ncbi:3-oxoadipyl-CoA thiolase [Tsukamurella ocularis]|uniref:3-oxoadipyl-CoA thiolase n=1 Tax=Tsukamurella ocularis TaxID=1970234 RepID=UPI0039EDEFA1
MSAVYLVDGTRTPIGRYAGALADVRPDDLAAHVLRALIDRHPDLDRERIDDVLLGCANQAGEDNRNVARMAALLAGLPVEVPGGTVNRLCGSGLDAVAQGARMIRTGDADLVLAGGVESMTRAPFVLPKSTAAWGRTNEVHDTTIGWRFVNPAMRAAYGVDAMAETAQNLATERGIDRAAQDAYALRSQQRAAAAIDSGRLAREITAIRVPRPRADPAIVDRDEHPRATTADRLAALRPITGADGSITAGNASGVNDGAAAVLLASERAVRRYALEPLARVSGAAVAGVPPRTMGIGPVPATRKLLGRHDIRLADVDVIEVNEAFAAQVLAVLRELGLPDDADHVNPHGGGIALGHPLGASGARLALTAALELADRGVRHGLATMCIGVGQGISMLLEAA